MESIELLPAVATIITPFVEQLVVPKFKNFLKSCGDKYKEYFSRNDYFGEYYTRSYEKYSIINTLVFHNSQRSLKDIYVNQRLVKENNYNKDRASTIIDGMPVKLIKKYKKILITDTAGMGKSTIMKRMFIDVIDNCIKDTGIPIYIELNRLNKDRTILDEIQENLDSLSEIFDRDLLLRLIQTGGFIFFLDGYDEISTSDRTEVTLDIQNFISKAGTNNYYIMTSRPESSLTSFGDFQSFSIMPLTKEEAYSLLEKYDISDGKEISKNLIELLKTGQYETIDEYLINPLLVSLLFTAYDYNRSIPFEKHRFYGVVFEAYFEKHDSSKPLKSRDKLSGLNYDGFDRVLRRVGFDCLVNVGVKFTEDEILNSIRKAKTYCKNLSFSESDFLKDLTSAVPIFCKDGTDYKWVHKSLLEYFAARFIFCDSKENQDGILSKIYQSKNIDKYINVLDLYYDIDYKGFNKNIQYRFCKEYVSYYESQSYTNGNISKDLIDTRKSNLFTCKPYIIKDNKRIISSLISKYQEDDFRSFLQDKGVDVEEKGYTHCVVFHYDEKTIVVYHLANTIELIGLLYCRSKQLFKDSIYYHKGFNGISVFLKKHCANANTYKIEINTGDENDSLYADVNSFFILFPTRFSRKDYYCLDYNACKKYVDDFERSSSEEDDIFEGI